MRFVSGGLNGLYLQEIAEQAHTIAKCRHIQAAIAYASDRPKLLELAKNHNAKLEFWCRHDETIPVALQILDGFIKAKSSNYVCRLIPDIFHAKVIWWHDYGVYIGSANLTDRGWLSNIEAGIFISEDEFVGKPLEDELVQFFKDLNSRSYPLSLEIYEELEHLQKEREALKTAAGRIKDGYEKRRKLPRNASLISVNKKDTQSKKRDEFLKEWYSTLQLLRDIGNKISIQYRPAWIDETVPEGVHTDRFMHAYYDKFVKDGNRAIHEERYEENKADPDKALVNAMEWWKNLEEIPKHVSERITKLAPYLQDRLSPKNILDMNIDEFANICSYVFAIGDHSLRVSYKSYGLSEALPSMSAHERINYLARWMYDRRSSSNRTILETLHYVLYEGATSNIPERIWNAYTLEEYKIPHLGISGIGEIVGWALPNEFPPRNGRTSKALKALGNNVTIHSN